MSISRGDSLTNVTENRQIFLKGYGIDESHLAQPVQISRAGIEMVNEPGKYPATDALITETPGVYLSILTADCSPVMIWSNEKPVIAAVHSGWQGSELNILGQTLQMVMDSFQVSPASLSIVIGPGLSQEHFEVGPEFEQKFQGVYLQKNSQNRHSNFNNNQFLLDTAVSTGVLKEQIEILPYCSFRDEHLFYSHRRDRGVTGRMMSVIGIKR